MYLDKNANGHYRFNNLKKGEKISCGTAVSVPAVRAVDLSLLVTCKQNTDAEAAEQ